MTSIPAPDPDEVAASITAEDVALVYGVSPATVRKWARDAELADAGEKRPEDATAD